MTKEEMLITVICSIIGSGVLSAFISHALYGLKLKKEQNFKFQNMIGEQMADALNKAYELADKLEINEKYEAYKQLVNGTFDVFSNKDVYPAIMDDFENLNKFITEVNDFRKETEKFLNSKIVLDLVYLDKYIIQLKVYASELGNPNYLPFLGIILKPDIDKWYVGFVKKIVENQNKTRCKVECHFGKKWNRLRKKLVDKRWMESALYKVMNNSFSEKDSSKLIEVGKILTELRIANKKTEISNE